MTILDTMKHEALFQRWFQGDSWKAWRAFLAALFRLRMSKEDLRIYRQHTGRERAPDAPPKEAWVVAGRRGGKSQIAALVAVFCACFRDYSRTLKPGEVGTVCVIASDRRQARTVLRYIRALLTVPALKALVTAERQESFDIAAPCGSSVSVEVHTASFRAVRGYTLIAAIADEIAYWPPDENSANPDREIIRALRPGLATIPAALLLCISSPYARRGMLWDMHKKHYGQDSPVLVWQAASRDMNPSLPQSVVDQAMEEDPAAARAEYLAEFRSDVENFLALEQLQPLITPGRIEIPPDHYNHKSIGLSAFVDPASGSGQDSMTLAIALKGWTGDPVTGGMLDRPSLLLLREIRPPFSPDEATAEFAAELKRYGVLEVTGDAYAAQWVWERFAAHGISYRLSKWSRSELYQLLLPLVNARRAELLDHPKLIAQLTALERRPSRSGRDAIDHGPRGHDDLANAAAGALVHACRSRSTQGAIYYEGQGVFH